MAQRQLQQALHQALKPHLLPPIAKLNLSHFGQAKAAINCGLFSSKRTKAVSKSQQKSKMGYSTETEKTTATTTQLAVTTTVTAVTSTTTDELKAEDIQLTYVLDLSRKNQLAAGVGEDESEIGHWEYVDSESDSEVYSEVHEGGRSGYSSSG